MKRFHVYAVAPTDYWDGTASAHDWLREPGAPRLIEERLRLWSLAEAAVRRHGLWDGALRGSQDDWPRVSAVPSGESDPYVVFMWKLENNGTTMVVSPVQLPWLDAFYGMIAVDRDEALESSGMELLRQRW